MRKTKIICTLGPVSTDLDVLRGLMKAGMNVARFNFSHGDHAEQKGKFEAFDRVRQELGLPVAALLDTKGPEIRLGDFEGERVQLVEGQLFTLTTDTVLGSNLKASVTYPGLKDDVVPGGRILIDDGLIELQVEEVRGSDIICRVMNGGPVSNHKGINAPGANLSMDYISEKDRLDILFGVEMGFDFVAASFARNKEDILAIRRLLDENNSKMKIIAKIENMQGIENLEEILEVSDGIMVARGDMGVEVPMEEVPILQKKLIKRAIARGKHVITATQMLESMMKNPRPTRAETTDIANAIYDGTTGIMLSGETAAGKYPVEALATMDRIAECAEGDIDYRNRLARLYAAERENEPSITSAIAHATCTTAMDLKAAAIITVTMAGLTASVISKYKPGCPIIGCCVDQTVWRQLNLLWGVKPLLIAPESDTESLFADAVSESVKAGYIKKGDVVVITAGVPLGETGKTNMIRVVEVE